MLNSIQQYISTTNATQYHSEAIIKEIITLLFIIFNKNTTTNTTASSTTTIICMYIHIIHKISILLHYIMNNIIQYTSSNSNNTVETLNYMRIMLNNMIQCIQIISENTNKLKYIINSSSSSTSSSDSSIIELNTINYYYCIINYYNICIHTNTILYSVYKYNNEKLNKYIDYIYTTIYNNITILLPSIEIILYELSNSSNSVLQYNSSSSNNNIKLNFIITSIYYIQKYCIHNNTTTTNYNNMMIINNIKNKRNNLLYKWVILISEILFTILYKPHSSGGKNLVFAPYFAEQLLLFVCLYKNNNSSNNSGGSNNSIKWIFNELAKVSSRILLCYLFMSVYTIHI